MGATEQRMKNLGIELQQSDWRGRGVVEATFVGDTLYVSAHFPVDETGKPVYVGRVGAEIDEEALKALDAKFRAALDNDLNTSLAVTALYDALKYNTNDDTKLEALRRFDSVLGLDVVKKGDARREELKKQQVKAGTFAVTFDGCDENPEVEALLKARQDAKKAKNFAEADAIRARVTEMGYAIEDTATGPKVRKA